MFVINHAVQVLFVVIAFNVCLSIPAAISTSEKILQPRIINGNVAKPGQFPYQVSMFKDGKQDCGGAVLNAIYVITAAHCIFENENEVHPERLTIKAGYIDLNSSLIQSFPVVAIYHPKRFDRRTFSNDVAILKVGIPFQMEKGVIEPVVLEDKTEVDHTPCVISGWGIQKQNTTIMPTKLYYAEIEIINHQVCKLAYQGVNTVDSKMICAGVDQGLKDACAGDSGGPLVCNGKLTGLVSWARGCGLPNYPGVYTKVLSHRKWIHSYINKGIKRI